MTNPSPNHVVKHISPSSGNASYVEVPATGISATVSALLGNGVPAANIFVFAPASLDITTQTVITVNGQPV